MYFSGINAAPIHTVYTMLLHRASLGEIAQTFCKFGIGPTLYGYVEFFTITALSNFEDTMY